MKYVTVNYFKTYIQDPSNENEKFLRVRIRKYRKNMEKEGLDTGKIIKRFNNIERKVNPDVVFSFVGPCYWKAKSPHLVGFAIPHIVYNDYKYVKKY